MWHKDDPVYPNVPKYEPDKDTTVIVNNQEINIRKRTESNKVVISPEDDAFR